MERYEGTWREQDKLRNEKREWRKARCGISSFVCVWLKGQNFSRVSRKESPERELKEEKIKKEQERKEKDNRWEDKRKYANKIREGKGKERQKESRNEKKR